MVRRRTHVCDKGEQCIYYHATFARNELPILEEGLRTCKSRAWEEYSCQKSIYVASKPDTALRWIIAWWIYNGYTSDDVNEGATIFEVDVTGLEIEIYMTWNVRVGGSISPDRIRVYDSVSRDEVSIAVDRIFNNAAYWTKCGIEETIGRILKR